MGERRRATKCNRIVPEIRHRSLTQRSLSPEHFFYLKLFSLRPLRLRGEITRFLFTEEFEGIHLR
jgi:hypothetical protein